MSIFCEVPYDWQIIAAASALMKLCRNVPSDCNLISDLAHDQIQELNLMQVLTAVACQSLQAIKNETDSY